MNLRYIITLGMLVCSAQIAGAGAWEDFESYTRTGSLETDTDGNWALIPGNGTVSVVADPLDAANQCLEIDAGNNNNNNNGAYRLLGDHTIPSGGSSVAVTFNIRAATANNNANTSIGLSTATGDTWGDFAAYVILKNGGLSSRDGGTERQVASNVGADWLQIVMEINPVSETYNVYLDGVRVATDFAFRSSGADLTAFKVYASANASDIAYVDSIEFPSDLVAMPDTYTFPFGSYTNNGVASVLNNDLNAESASALLVADMDTSDGSSLTLHPDGTFDYITAGEGTNTFWYSAVSATSTSTPAKVTLISAPDLSDIPNVLFITVDDLNDVPTFMGRYPDAYTPNMDRLAASGVAFLNAHCTMPICGPSRASFMSGLRPSSLGMTENHHPDINEVLARVEALGGTTLDLHFKQAGYRVFSAGKVYHNGQNTSAPDMIGGRPYFGADEGINFPSSSTLTDWGMPSYGDSDDNFSDKANAEFAVARLQETHAAPFLLMVGFVQPHVPWYTPQAYLDLYPNPSSLTLHHYDANDYDDIPQESVDRNYLSYMPHRDDMIQQGQADDIIHHYLACTSFTDHYLGQVLDALEASPYATNTIVVLLSDHGYHLGEKNTYQKHSLYERSSHVPLIVAGPGITASQTCSRVVSLADVFPTLIDLCNLSDNPVMEGRSLVPLLEDPAAEWDYPALITWRGNNYAVQTEQFRYYYYSQGSEELYDHSVDLHEITNLASNAAYDSVKEELKQYLPLNMLSPGFPVKFPPNSGTAADYLTYLLGTGDLRMYNQPVTDLAAVVEGMRLNWYASSGYNSGTYLNFEMVPNGPYGDYRTTLFSLRDLRDLTISGALANADNDGAPLLVEYALALDPEIPDGPEGPRIVQTATSTVARIEFDRMPERNDIDLRLLMSTNLVTGEWITVAESLQGGVTIASNGFSAAETGTTTKEVSVDCPLLPGGPDEMFLRFQAEP